MIDTHAHLDGEEFNADRDEVVMRAREAGVTKIFIPAIDLPSVDSVLATCNRYPGYAYPMIGLHPEEVKADWRDVLDAMKPTVYQNPAVIAIGEVGLDYYWSREYEHEQLLAFEQQVQWSVETRLPLMIHCRKAQNEMVRLLRRYADDLPGGVFHCFTGNAHEAEELLQFDRFVLGIGGVLTFKKSHLPETLAGVAIDAQDTTASVPNVPLDRIVLETDSPYMAPVPMRGKRNESAYVRFVLQRLAQSYGVSVQQLSDITDANVRRIFGV